MISGSEYVNKLFETMYAKFLDTIEKYDLIPADTEKVCLGMSGGKDAQVMTLLMNEYKKRVRPDLELELLIVKTPSWKYEPDKYYAGNEAMKEYATTQKKSVDTTIEYWEKQGIHTKLINYAPEVSNEVIMRAEKPCVMCFIGLYRSLCGYIKEQYEQGKKTVLSIGITKFDLLYVLESLTIRSNGNSWEYDKLNSPDKYYFNRLQTTFFSPYPKLILGIPGTDAAKITPIINLTDNETRELANQLGLPRIPDPCAKLHGEKFVSDKRYFDSYLAGTTTEDINLDHIHSGFFSDYQSLLDTFTRVGVLPPRSELDGLMYEAINNSKITAIYE